MTTGWLDNTFLLMLGAAAVWFALRFILGPKITGFGRGAPSLGSFFRRESPTSVDGLGRNSIATVLNDTKAFVLGENALRGLLLAGPFATRRATITSTITLVALCDAPESYAEPDWLLRWAYPARDHKVMSHECHQEPGLVTHHLALRGAPPITVHFVLPDSAAPPEALVAALTSGLSVIDDPAGQAERLRRRWESVLRPPDGVQAQKQQNKKEETS